MHSLALIVVHARAPIETPALDELALLLLQSGVVGAQAGSVATRQVEAQLRGHALVFVTRTWVRHWKDKGHCLLIIGVLKFSGQVSFRHTCLSKKLHFQEQKSLKSGTQHDFPEHISKRIPTLMK